MFSVTVLNVYLCYYIYIAFAFCCLVISLVCDITSYVMNVHLTLNYNCTCSVLFVGGIS